MKAARIFRTQRKITVDFFCCIIILLVENKLEIVFSKYIDNI